MIKKQDSSYPKKCNWCNLIAHKEVWGTLTKDGILCDCGYLYKENNYMLRQEKKSDTILIPTRVSENTSSQ